MRTRWLFLVSVGLVGALLLLLRPPSSSWPSPADDRPGSDGSSRPELDGDPSRSAVPTPARAGPDPEAASRRRDDRPLQVDPAAPRFDPEFDGRTARLAGRVVRGEQGVDARVAIVAGMNRASVETDGDGRFVFPRLIPGFARLEVRQNDVPVLERDLVVRNRVVEDLHIDLLDEMVVVGRVLGPDGEPLAGVDVRGDRRRTSTSSDGSFAVRVSPDSALRLTRTGHAPRELRAWRAGEPTIRLDRGGSLAISLPVAPWGTDQAHVYVLPAGEQRAGRAALHPWNRLLPLVMFAGEERRLDDLPAQRVEVLALGGRGFTEVVPAEIRPGSVARAELRWTALPELHGEVLGSDGAPRSGARIDYSVFDPGEVTGLLLGPALRHRRSLPFAPAPCTHQQVRADAAGRFVLAVPPARRTHGFTVVRSGSHAPVRQRVPRDAGSLQIRVPW